MNSQEPSPHQSLLFSAAPALQELTGNSFRINSGATEPGSAHSSTQQCSRTLARNVPNFLVAPADQTSLPLDYSESKKRLVVLTSRAHSQSEGYRDKLQEYSLTDPKGVEVSTRLFEECYCFSLCSRLSPKWNRFGSMLVMGQGFLSGHKTQTVLALKLDSNLQAGELCISIVPYSITYRPLDLMAVLNQSQGRIMPDTPESLELLLTQDLSKLSVPCQILPNLTRGYVHSVSREPLRSSPLPDYAAVCEYWRSVHGYQLPREAAPYFVNVSFQWGSSRALTYPLSCVLTERSVMSRYSPASTEQVVSTFLKDINAEMPSICGHELYFSQKVQPTVPHHLQEAPSVTNTQKDTMDTPVENTVTTQPVSTPTLEKYKPCFKAKLPSYKLKDISNLPPASQTKSVPSQSQPAYTPKQPKAPIPPSLPPIKSPLSSIHSNNNTSSSPKEPDTHPSVPMAPPNARRDPPRPASPSIKAPAAKKQRMAKPAASVEELIRAGQLEKANISSLNDWLREKKITFKSKDKKAQLLALVRQHSILMSES